MSPPTRSQDAPRIGGRQGAGAISVERDPELERFERSLRRSRDRRAASRRPTGVRWHRAAALGAVIAASWLLVAAAELDLDASSPGAGAAGSAARGPAVVSHDSPVLPAASAIDVAWRYARERGGLVSLAVIDSEGRMHSFEGERAYVSASVVKALLLAAELERLEAAGLPLDGATGALLTRMITISDNEAADEIYYRVGDAGLYEVARRTGMKSFSVAGHWGNAQVTAEDMARLMWRLDDALAGPHREFGLGLLGSVTGSQRWGGPPHRRPIGRFASGGAAAASSSGRGASQRAGRWRSPCSPTQPSHDYAVDRAESPMSASRQRPLALRRRRSIGITTGSALS